jgi:hypothetical protein
MVRIETLGTGQSLRMTEQYRFNFRGVAICDIRIYVCVCIERYVNFQGLEI